MDEAIRALQEYLFDKIVVDPISPGGCLGLVYCGRAAIWFYRGWDEESNSWHSLNRTRSSIQRIVEKLGNPEAQTSDYTLHKWTPDGSLYLFAREVVIPGERNWPHAVDLVCGEA